MARANRATITAEEYRERTTEAEMRETIREAVALAGGRLWYIRDSRNSPETEDMPDLLILLPGRILLLELKSQKRRLTKGQEAVARLMATVSDARAGVVRPRPAPGEYDLDMILHLITGGASV